LALGITKQDVTMAASVENSQTSSSTKSVGSCDTKSPDVKTDPGSHDLQSSSMNIMSCCNCDCIWENPRVDTKIKIHFIIVTLSRHSDNML